MNVPFWSTTSRIVSTSIFSPFPVFHKWWFLDTFHGVHHHSERGLHLYDDGRYWIVCIAFDLVSCVGTVILIENVYDAMPWEANRYDYILSIILHETAVISMYMEIWWMRISAIWCARLLYLVISAAMNCNNKRHRDWGCTLENQTDFETQFCAHWNRRDADISVTSQ